MSVKLISLVWERAPYSSGSLLVFLALADWSNDSGVSWPSVPKIANKTRLEKRSVQYIIRQLKSDGLLEIEERRGRGHQNRYTINVQNLRLLPSLVKDEIDDTENVQSDAEKVKSTTQKVQPIAPDPLEEPSVKQPSIDPPYAGERFVRALTSFQNHRVAMNKPLSKEAERLLYQKLARWPEMIAAIALEDSVINRWQGVFEPRGNGNGQYQQDNGLRRPDAAERNEDRLNANLELIQELRRDTG